MTGCNTFRYYKQSGIYALIVFSIFTYFICYYVGETLKEHVFKNYSENYSTKILLDILLGYFGWLFIVSATVYLIDTSLWKHKLLKQILNLPNLSGRYEGFMHSSYFGENEVKTPCAIEISQCGSSITITCYFKRRNSDEPGKTKSSESRSDFENLRQEKNGQWLLSYKFTNEPDKLTSKELDSHDGYCELRYIQHSRKLEGAYFNYRGNHGRIEVAFESQELNYSFAPREAP